MLKVNDLTALKGGVGAAYEFMPYSSCANCAERDTFNEKSIVVADVDKVNYYLAINLWLGYVNDNLGPNASQMLAMNITRDGLVQTIDDANLLYDLYRANTTFWSQTSTQIDEIPFDLWSWEALMSGPRDRVLNALCFLRRFSSPMFNESLEQAGLEKFLAVNDRCRKLEMKSLRANVEEVKWNMYSPSLLQENIPERPISTYLLERLRATARKYINECAISPKLHLYSPEVLEMGYFSSGAVGDTGKTLYEKLVASAWHSPICGTSLLGHIPMTRGHWVTCEEENGLATEYASYVGISGATSTIKAVPKTYKTSRIIAMEEARNAFCGQALNAYLEKYVINWHGHYDKTTQLPNRAAAIEGSFSDQMATIDSSSASDSISKEILRLIYPPRYYELIMEAAATHAAVGNKRVKLYTALTSGTGLTFTNETSFFCIVVDTAYDIAETYGEEDLIPFVVFGDDIVCDRRVYDLVCHILDMLGIVVNDQKSYAFGTHYRESCGVEAYLGYHWDADYFPRSGLVTGSMAEIVSSLVEMQHKLYYVAPSCSRFLTCVTKNLAPWMTGHKAGTNCTDLWMSRDYTDQRQLSPYAEIKSVYSPFTDEEFTYLSKLESREESYLPLYATLVNHPRKPRKLLWYDLVEEYRYLQWLKNPSKMETVPNPNGDIELYPLAEQVAPLLFGTECGWEYRA